jgi:heme/copper-type cytochrome/quinol oxidase subunit 2
MRKGRNEKIVEKPAPASTLMTDLKFGISFIVIGLVIWLIIRYVADAGNYANKGNVISIANWIFALFVVIGIFLMGYGAAEYSYAKRRRA